MSLRVVYAVCVLAVCIIFDSFALAQSQPTKGVELVLDTSEAEQALLILQRETAHQPVTPQQWQALFATAPYQALKAREAAIGRAFTDQDFQTFLSSPSSIDRIAEWQETLARMKATDLTGLARNVLVWLPQGATIKTRVFPEIKPIPNSFVWAKPGERSTIFLYLERTSGEKFENTVAHECHHIGLQSLSKQQDALFSTLPKNVKTTVDWLGGFGEGEAMLAAAGSATRHPHWEDDGIARARWDGDMMHFNNDLHLLERFFLDILDGTLLETAAIAKRAAPFFGDVQGAFYTVGYQMAALVAQQEGPLGFDTAVLDPRELLIRYNRIAAEANTKGATLALWSPALMARLQSSPK